MAIKITQPGQAKAAAQAGAIIGKGKRAEEERARVEREQARAQQIAAQQAARQAALDWERQKMLLNSQQDFAHEMRMRQAGLDAEARAQEWQVEKMEIASRMDFEQEEQERLRIKAEYAAGRDTLDKKKEEMPAGEYERALFRLDSIYAPKGVPAAVEGLGFDKERPPSFAAKKSAAKYLEETELGWKERHLPGFLGGRELTKTEQQLRAEAESVLSESVPTGTITTPEPIYQENKRTGQKRVSYDNGVTWQIL